jgi:hypothetical protein
MGIAETLTDLGNLLRITYMLAKIQFSEMRLKNIAISHITLRIAAFSWLKSQSDPGERNSSF